MSSFKFMLSAMIVQGKEVFPNLFSFVFGNGNREILTCHTSFHTFLQTIYTTGERTRYIHPVFLLAMNQFSLERAHSRLAVCFSTVPKIFVAQNHRIANLGEMLCGISYLNMADKCCTCFLRWQFQFVKSAHATRAALRQVEAGLFLCSCQVIKLRICWCSVGGSWHSHSHAKRSSSIIMLQSHGKIANSNPENLLCLNWGFSPTACVDVQLTLKVHYAKTTSETVLELDTELGTGKETNEYYNSMPGDIPVGHISEFQCQIYLHEITQLVCT